MLDYLPDRAGILRSVEANGVTTPIRQVNGHVIVPAAALRAGENSLALDFNAGDAPLNRSDDFLYTIFVPARAHLAFPCFDQPDLKARWSLALDVPDGWQALGNGAELEREPATADGRASASRRRSRFRPTCSRSPRASSASSRRSATAARSACSTARPTPRRWRATATRSSICTPSALAWLEQYTGDPVPVRQVRFPARAGVPVRRHGAPRRDLLQRQRPAARRERDAGPDARARQRHRARDRAHVVRRSGHDAVVQRRVDEGGLRQPHGGEDREPGVPGAEPRPALSASTTTRRPTTSTAPPAPTRSASRSRTSTRPARSTARSFTRRRRSSCASSRRWSAPTDSATACAST